MRLVLGPMLKAGKVGFRLLAAPSSLVLRTLARFTGSGFLRDLAGFMLAFEGMYEGFKERAARVKELLASPRTGFVLVTGPNPLTTEEAPSSTGRWRPMESGPPPWWSTAQRDPRRHGGPDIEGLRRPCGWRRSRTRTPRRAPLPDAERAGDPRHLTGARSIGCATLRGVPLVTVPRLRKDARSGRLVADRRVPGGE
jgi:hypothetical protein